MAKHDIQKSRHLLKRLEEEMIFLRSLMHQIDSLSHQAFYASSGVKKTWSDIDQVYNSWNPDIKDKDF